MGRVEAMEEEVIGMGRVLLIVVEEVMEAGL